MLGFGTLWSNLLWGRHPSRPITTSLWPRFFCGEDAWLWLVWLDFFFFFFGWGVVDVMGGTRPKLTEQARIVSFPLNRSAGKCWLWWCYRTRHVGSLLHRQLTAFLSGRSALPRHRPLVWHPGQREAGVDGEAKDSTGMWDVAVIVVQRWPEFKAIVQFIKAQG